MLNEFTSLYHDDEMIKNVFGEYNGSALLKNAKRIFGGREQVFFEYGKDESLPIYDSVLPAHKKPVNKNVILSVNSHIESPSGLTVISMHSDDPDTSTTRYDANYLNQYCRPVLLGNFKTFETKRYFSIDLSYILSISRAFTDLKFDQFEGEGLRILKAWIFVMTYGIHHPDEYELIMVQSSKNEYGESARNRSIVRNSYYKPNVELNKMGAPYGESSDEEWALSADDYAKVAALDSIFTELSKGSSLLYNGTIVPDLIRGTREYGKTIPAYFGDLIGAKNETNSNNIKGY